jgi:hypothetical protein
MVPDDAYDGAGAATSHSTANIRPRATMTSAITRVALLVIVTERLPSLLSPARFTSIIHSLEASTTPQARVTILDLSRNTSRGSAQTSQDVAWKTSPHRWLGRSHQVTMISLISPWFLILHVPIGNELSLRKNPRPSVQLLRQSDASLRGGKKTALGRQHWSGHKSLVCSRREPPLSALSETCVTLAR